MYCGKLIVITSLFSILYKLAIQFDRRLKIEEERMIHVDQTVVAKRNSEELFFL